MRRRFFWFQAVTLTVALVALLMVSSIVMQVTNAYYRKQAVPAADQRSDQVQMLLSDWAQGAEDWEALSETLKELGYQLVVEENDQMLYSTLDLFQQEFYERIQAESASWPTVGTLIVQNDGMMMIGRDVGDYTIVAVQEPHMPKMLGQMRPLSEGMMLTLLISGVSAIIVIVLLSLLFTRYQMQRVLRPVNALIQAAGRVGQGDFSTPIDYQGRDEFTSVCRAFDHMQRQLLQEREKNARYEKARTDLVAGISHDLRTPLTAVKGYIQGLRDGVANTPEKQKQYLTVAYRRSCDMERLLQRLFYFSKMETGNVPLLRAPVRFDAFLMRFSEDTRAELAAAGGEIVLECGAGPHVVRIDAEQIYRVLINLKENAVRYAGAQPLVLRLTLTREGSWEHLRFADNGCGVPEDMLPYLFDQFWRGDEARRRRKGEGSGLGLYIAKYIIEAHGGTIAAKNEEGLVFDLALPGEEADNV